MASKAESTHLTLESVRELIAKDEADVEITGLEEEPGSGRGDNYTSMLYRVHAKGLKQQKDGGRVPWSCAIIYKVLPQSKEHRDAFKSEALFKNEVAFYTHVWPALERVQKDAKIFRGVAKIYAARANLIAMEDLRQRGFVMADRRKGLQVEALKLVLESLASFHALSLTLKDLRQGNARMWVQKHFESILSWLLKVLLPTFIGDQLGIDKREEFARLSRRGGGEGVEEALFRKENEDWYRQYYRVAANNAIAMVSDALPTWMEDRREEIMGKLKSFLKEDTFFRTMCELAAAQGPLTVFCHGDCWTNNFLFQDQASAVTPAVYLVDFQLSRVGSLALDLANLLYCCTSGEVRRTHMTQLLRYYHQRLMSCLHTLNPHQPVKNPSVMWKLLNEEIRRCGRFGVGLALDILPISTCASDEAPDLYEDEEESEKKLSTRAPPAGGTECARLMTDLVLELIDNDAL